MVFTTTIKRGSRGQDVREVQALLNSNGAHPRLGTDGVFGGDTERAVRSFQSSHGLGVDGQVGRFTWRALNNLYAPTSLPEEAPRPAPAPTPSPVVSGASDFCFPLARRPSPDWTGGARFFGANRSGGKRKHAGCDLLGPRGTTIYAVADGTLIRGPYHFYEGTDAVEIRHGSFIVRYGEILPGSYTGGRTVRKGQAICQIGRLNSGSSMLHLELYSNGASTASLSGGGVYRRRSDVINPAPYLEQWVRHLPV